MKGIEIKVRSVEVAKLIHVYTAVVQEPFIFHLKRMIVILPPPFVFQKNCQRRVECDAVRERGLAAEKRRGRTIPDGQIFDLGDALGPYANEENEDRTRGGSWMILVEDISREFIPLRSIH